MARILRFGVMISWSAASTLRLAFEQRQDPASRVKHHSRDVVLAIRLAYVLEKFSGVLR
jgi:hypothetical protein